MRIVMFCHSIRSCWNNGHAHFLRGVARAWSGRGHQVDVYEPVGAWSVENAAVETKGKAISKFHNAYPEIVPHVYAADGLDLDAVLKGADAVIVDEWNEPELVERIGQHRRGGGDYLLYWRDAHHRAVSAPAQIAAFDLSGYDAVLAFGAPIAERYLSEGWADRAFVWHEAADVRLFAPVTAGRGKDDVVWVGNWGDEERTGALQRYLLEPTKRLGLRTTMYGVRYPEHARRLLDDYGVRYGGWLANTDVPRAFGEHRATLHVPRGPYVEDLAGIPTIRVFEALACGTPLVSAPWQGADEMFTPGRDFVLLDGQDEACDALDAVVHDKDKARALADHGRKTVLRHHTCDHRAASFERIHRSLRNSAGRDGPVPLLTSPGAPASQRLAGARRRPRTLDRSAGPSRATHARPATRADRSTAAETSRLLHATASPARSHVSNHYEPTVNTRNNMPRQTISPQETTQDRQGCTIAFFGSSLLSSYWNGAATYYRGLLKALADEGCQIRFFEPDAYDRPQHRDIEPPAWAEVQVWDADGTNGADAAVEGARGADVVVKASGVGVHDEHLERAVLSLQDEDTRVVYWDVDAPATLERIHDDPDDDLRALVPRYDQVFTYGGGPKVVEAYEQLGARRCVPIYNAVDTDTHHPVDPDPRYEADLSLMANRLPDREARVRSFFLEPAARLPSSRFILGGSGWEPHQLTDNVHSIGHVPVEHHNAFNVSPRAVLNVTRDSMARFGHSPATRVFEVAGAGGCLVSDAWDGIETFLEPEHEVLLVEDADDVVDVVEGLDVERARAIGKAARKRVLKDHTYKQRAVDVLDSLRKMGVDT